MRRAPLAVHAPGQRGVVRRLKLRAVLDVRALPVESQYARRGEVLVVQPEDLEEPRYVAAVDVAEGTETFTTTFLYARYASVQDLGVLAQVIDPKRLVRDLIVAL